MMMMVMMVVRIDGAGGVDSAPTPPGCQELAAAISRETELRPNGMEYWKTAVCEQYLHNLWTTKACSCDAADPPAKS